MFLDYLSYLFLIFPILFFLFWLICYISNRSLKKNGVEVEAIVKDIKEIRDSNNYLIEKEVYVEFYYNGHKKLQLYDASNQQIGDKIVCIYDAKNNYISRKKANNSNKKGSKAYHILLLISIFLILFFILMKYLSSVPMEENFIINFSVYLFENHGKSVAIILTILETFVVPLPFIIVGIILYKRSKVNDKYIKINGIVKDILKRTSSNSDGISKDVYSPIFEFNYNGQNMTYTNPTYRAPLKYKIGDNVILFMDSSNGKIIEEKEAKSNRTLGILLIIIPILFSLFEIISMILESLK